MSKLPRTTARKAIRAFGKVGFIVARKGKHTILLKEGHRNALAVPEHKGKDLPTGTLRALIKDSGLTIQQFRDLL